MKIHIISLSSWNEPRRIRRQLTELLLSKYEVEYHSPYEVNDDFEINGRKLFFKKFTFLKKYASVPVVGIVNAIFMYFHLKNNVNKGDFVFNFIPELMLIPFDKSINIVSVINDDYSLMVKKFLSWWMTLLIRNMCSRSVAVLYVSRALMNKYKAKKQFLFYPWADRVEQVNSERVDINKKDTILYWGYICHTLDYNLIEDMAKQIKSNSLRLNIVLAGPVSQGFEDRVSKLVSEHSCISYCGPTDKLSDLEIERVLFGLEPIHPNYKNSEMLEMPNKGPRFLAHSIPLVYSGCSLLNEPFFIEYSGDLVEIVKSIKRNHHEIIKSIDIFFAKNNSNEKIILLENLIFSDLVRFS